MKTLIGAALLLLFQLAQAEQLPVEVHRGNVLQQIKRLYPECSVELQGPLRWTQGQMPGSDWIVRVSGDSGRGEVYLHGESADYTEQSYGVARFRATLSVRLATRRIKIGERLMPENFRTEQVLVSSGPYQAQRLDLATSTLSLDRLESAATLIEGAPLYLSQVQKIPDIRRGDRVQIKLMGKGLVLSTSGLAEESGLIHGRVRVMTSRSKRELVGEVMEDGSVEVAL